MARTAGTTVAAAVDFHDELRFMVACDVIPQPSKPGDRHLTFRPGPVQSWWEGELASSAALMFIEPAMLAHAAGTPRLVRL